MTDTGGGAPEYVWYRAADSRIHSSDLIEMLQDWSVICGRETNLGTKLQPQRFIGIGKIGLPCSNRGKGLCKDTAGRQCRPCCNGGISRARARHPVALQCRYFAANFP